MDEQLTQFPGVVIGELAGADPEDRPLVRIDDREPVRARAVWMAEPPDWARCAGLRVVLGFVDGDCGWPVILGLLDAPPREPQKTPDTIRIASGKDLVIECGKSKIALRADGRIEIRGGHLISRSSGPNKVKGGTVHIN